MINEPLGSSHRVPQRSLRFVASSLRLRRRDSQGALRVANRYASSPKSRRLSFRYLGRFIHVSQDYFVKDLVPIIVVRSATCSELSASDTEKQIYL
ncbi:hypothetical protein SCP_0603280 [Sparassis crispa]|uniref:Uncharacterized protein n=1 Tax=Sparassis crispa TaxID=139825 RepID=A0A401GQB7_9APHY|nr:hypothetical protein SCP_0603280 [Sparassis crispa]GBE84350.1 hypothetical protein SCP_0603280 [Sparassis crispa]